MIELTRDDILKMDDCTVIPLVIPEWNNAQVYIRTISGHERDEIESAGRRMLKDGVNVDLRARYAACALSDSEGKRVFRDSDISMLAKKNQLALQRIMEAAIKHNRIGDGWLEDVEKNLETDPSASSGSD